MMYLIKVTPEIMLANDITNCSSSMVERSRQCQVAAAFKEATGDDWGLGWHHATRVKDGVIVRLPEEVAISIYRMDSIDGHSVQPFAFEVDIP